MMGSMSEINAFLRANALRLTDNPCVSPDFCLDWSSLSARLERAEGLTRYPQSRFQTAAGWFELVSDVDGDHAFVLEANGRGDQVLRNGLTLGGGRVAFPASYQNLLLLKNAVLAFDAGSTIFPTASGTLEKQSLGVGARFTTLHWPAVEWAMAELSLSLTANQNSIPRELVFDVETMLRGELETVAFPFIGSDVPEGHQGQSVEGMSHGAVLSKLKTGFHRRRIAWGFNADHQPIGGKFDSREQRLVDGCLFATYITFDLSPELAVTQQPADPRAWCSQHISAELVKRIGARVLSARVELNEAALFELLSRVWPSLLKMQRRDRLYREARERAFTSEVGRRYFRELSIDELPGLTTPETLAIMLASCEALDMPVQFVAPAFGFQKNSPFDDLAELERRVSRAWAVCSAFGVSIGFHSGSGKSRENYQICGRITGGKLEIKTSGRYTYEMGRALAASSEPSDRALFADWYRFTRELSTKCAFSSDAAERDMSRSFVLQALKAEGANTDVFQSPESLQRALEALPPSPDHMFWFEYNFLFVLAAGGQADKAKLGDHSPEGYRQRARFYNVSDAARLAYARNVAEYLCFLAETTGLVPVERYDGARRKLAEYSSYAALLRDIAPAGEAG